MIAAETLTMQTAAQSWLEHLQNRRRRPIKLSSAKTFESYLAKWILPRMGSLEVSGVGVAVLRDFIGHLAEAGLSAKTQNEIVSCVKAIITNCADADGNPLFLAPKTWTGERLDLPVVKHSEQHTPVVTSSDIENALARSDEQYRCLFTLASGSGLRIGELLSIKLVEDGTSTVLDARAAVIHVRQTMWRGREQTTKTEAGVRDVEIPFELSKFIAGFAGDRKGFLFGNGKCLDVTSARNHLDVAIGKEIGFHAFRRFRTTVLRKARVNEEILKFWLGHRAVSSVTDIYSRVALDETFRREECERAGYGFVLPFAQEHK